MKTGFLTFSIFFLIATLCAQGNPEVQRQEAYNKIQVASQLVEEARRLVEQRRPTVENLESARNLMIRAGRNFEEAAHMLRLLGPQRVPEEEILNCEQAVQSCIEFIEKINQQLLRIR